MRIGARGLIVAGASTAAFLWLVRSRVVDRPPPEEIGVGAGALEAVGLGRLRGRGAEPDHRRQQESLRALGYVQ